MPAQQTPICITESRAAKLRHLENLKTAAEISYSLFVKARSEQAESVECSLDYDHSTLDIDAERMLDPEIMAMFRRYCWQRKLKPRDLLNELVWEFLGVKRKRTTGAVEGG